MRLCLRVTVAALASFVLAQLFTIPLAGLWAVLTAVDVTQMSLGGSLKATIEYSVGTLGGAVYAGTIATLVPHYDEISLLAVLALAVAPLALLGHKGLQMTLRYSHVGNAGTTRLVDRVMGDVA